MITYLFEKNILIYVMLGLCGLGVLVKFILSLVYGRLIRSSDKMGTSKNKLMKNLRQKFETSYSLNLGVNNVDIFVDKYVYKHRICGILLYTWENICGQLLLLCMLTGSLGALLAIINEGDKTVILSTFFVGISTSALLVLVDNLVNLSTKKGVVKANIQDYLENCLKVRLASGQVVEAAEAVGLKKAKAAAAAAAPATVKPDKSEKLENDVSKMYEVNKKEEKIIEDILKEYIV